jgi:DNA-binding response OmpR family regulator
MASEVPERILIVEDEVLIRWQIQMAMEKMGITHIDECGDSKCVADRINRRRYDLVLMDIGLDDGFDGVELARTIRARHAVPIIFVSAYVDRSRSEEIRGLSDGFVGKPFLEEGIQETVRRVYRAHRHT